MSVFPWDAKYVRPGTEPEPMPEPAKPKPEKVAKRVKKDPKPDDPIVADPHGPLYYVKDEDITHSQLEQVNAFVTAYLQTWSPGLAWKLSGGSPHVSASKAGFDLLQSPAVQKRLNAVVESLEEEQLLSRKTVLMGLLKEAHHYGGDATHGGRIRAWMGLARIKKMDVQVTEQNINVRGGVMVIPGAPDGGEIIDVEMWEKASETQQQLLKEDVRK